MFILTRDGVPIYAGRQIEWVVKTLVQKLLDQGYTTEMIDKRETIIESREPLVAIIHHPQFQESWRIYSVFAD